MRLILSQLSTSQISSLELIRYQNLTSVYQLLDSYAIVILGQTRDFYVSIFNWMQLKREASISVYQQLKKITEDYKIGGGEWSMIKFVTCLREKK